jgi:hypothetical protein
MDYEGNPERGHTAAEGRGQRGPIPRFQFHAQSAIPPRRVLHRPATLPIDNPYRSTCAPSPRPSLFHFALPPRVCCACCRRKLLPTASARRVECKQTSHHHHHHHRRRFLVLVALVVLAPPAHLPPPHRAFDTHADLDSHEQSPVVSTSCPSTRHSQPSLPALPALHHTPPPNRAPPVTFILSFIACLPACLPAHLPSAP